MPATDYVAFENDAMTFTYRCIGNGTSLYWTVDDYTTGQIYVRDRGIWNTYPIMSSDGLNIFSHLIVPTTKTNNNISVICNILDSSFNSWSSDPVKLTLQGIVMY